MALCLALHFPALLRPQLPRRRFLFVEGVFARPLLTGATKLACFPASCFLLPASCFLPPASCLLPAPYPGGHVRPRPPSTCRWMWKTVCPACALVLKTVLNPLSA